MSQVNNKVLLSAEFLYPHLIHLPLPYVAIIDKKNNVRGAVYITSHVVGSVVNDNENRISITKDKRIFEMEKANEGKFDHIQVFVMSAVPIEETPEGNPGMICMEHNNSGDRSKITYTRYSSKVMVIWKARKKADYVDADFDRGREIFDVFLADYRNVSGDPYVRLTRDIVEPSLERILCYEGDDIPDGSLTLESLARERCFKLLKFRMKFVLSDPRVEPKPPEDVSKLLSEKLKNGNSNTAWEIMDEARVAFNSKRDFKLALLESAFAMELAVDEFVTKAKIARGVSQKAIVESRMSKNHTYILTTELPVFVKYNSNWEKLIHDCTSAKKIRNDVVHRGRYPKEEEARQAVAVATGLLKALRDEEDEMRDLGGAQQPAKEALPQAGTL
jgi:hypothetical protein